MVNVPLERAWWLGHHRYSLGKKVACRSNERNEAPRSLTGTAHPLFDADTDTRRRYWDISLRVNDCPSRIVFE